MRWLIRNTDAHRMFRAVVGSGASWSMTAWMRLSSGDAPEKPCFNAIGRPRGEVDIISSGPIMDISVALMRAGQRDAHQHTVDDWPSV